MFIKNLTGLARFSAEKMGKIDLARGETLFAGLNCFEPGQEHAPHTHAGRDKLYVILTGDAEVRIGDESAMLTAGDAAFAPSGVVHSIRNVGQTRLVAMAVIAPPPENK